MNFNIGNNSIDGGLEDKAFIPDGNRASSTLFREILAKKPLSEARKMAECPTPRFWALQPIKMGVFLKQGYHHTQWQRRLLLLKDIICIIMNKNPALTNTNYNKFRSTI
eukprot:UN05490